MFKMKFETKFETFQDIEF